MPNIEQITTKLYKHYTGVADTRTNRDFFEEALGSSFNVRPDQLWMYGDQIPRPLSPESKTYKRIKNLDTAEVEVAGDKKGIFYYQKDEASRIELFKKYVDYPLQKIDDGTDNAFKLVYAFSEKELAEMPEGERKIKSSLNGKPITNIIPFNYAGDLYNYQLKMGDSNKRIYFGVGDWQLDTFSGVLTFYGKVPKGIDHNNPPKVSFYQYTGGTGFRQDTFGFDGAALPIDNWFIHKGEYILSSNQNNENESLYQTICRIADKVDEGFADKFGWDGADKNEGIALPLEKIIALEYTFSKDKVKGYDESADAEIGTLLSSKHIVPEDESQLPFKVTFVSQGIDVSILNSINVLERKDHTINITGGTASFDGGKAVNLGKGIYKLPNPNNDGFIIIDSRDANSDSFEDAELVFHIRDMDEEITPSVNALLLYWDISKQSYLPFIPKEDMKCNFGFSVVTANGRIPPSVKMDSAAISAYSDSITPDYYGPRNYSVTVALEGEYSTKSADYVVKNTGLFYLNNIIDNIIEDFTVSIKDKRVFKFNGAIFLRAGTYEIDGDIDLSKFSNLEIIGESAGSVIIKSKNPDTLNKITYNNSKSVGLLALNNITLSGISLDIKAAQERVILKSVLAPSTNSNLDISQEDGSVFIMDSSFGGKVSLKGEPQLEIPQENNNTYITYSLKDSIFGAVDVSSPRTLLQGITANKATFNLDDPHTYAKDCLFSYVDKKPDSVQLRGCSVTNFSSSISRRSIPNLSTFPIYSKTDTQKLQYVSFENYFFYNEDQCTIELNIDADVLDWKDYLDEDGNPILDTDGTPLKMLSCHINAEFVSVDHIFSRHQHYYDADGKPTDNGGTLKGALADLYLTKADLIKGKVPLTELPDSVAYGGLLYIGAWSFDDNNGQFPTFEETIKTHPHLSLDLKVDENKLQPGWFWVVSASNELNIDNPVSNQYTTTQYTFDDSGKIVILQFAGSDEDLAKIKNLSKDEVDEILNGPESDLRALLSRGGDVYTAGDWIIWNGSFFEKLDRAYQDPVYTILPVYTLGTDDNNNNGRISWSWKQTREGTNWGWGLGALDLSKKTIGESFDQVNIELRKLQVQPPVSLQNSELEPETLYKISTFREVRENAISPNTYIAYDATLDRRVPYMTFHTPQINDWKHLIFFSDKATLVGNIFKGGAAESIDHEACPISINTTESQKVTDMITDESGLSSFPHMVGYSKPVDPYQDESVGRGYWKGMSFTIRPRQPLGEGTYAYKLSLEDVYPNNPKLLKDVQSSLEKDNIRIIYPEKATEIKEHAVPSVVTLNDINYLINKSKSGACSGVRELKMNSVPVQLRLALAIKDAFPHLINSDSNLQFNLKTNISDPTPVSSYNIMNKGKYNTISNNDYNFSVKSNLLTDKLTLTVELFDIYGQKIEIPLNIDKNCIIRVDPTSEEERKFSGTTLYPPILNSSLEKLENISFACLSKYDSNTLLTEENYIGELLKVGRLIEKDNGEQEVVSEYKWPVGYYRFLEGNEGDDFYVADYTKVDSGIEVPNEEGNTDIYRFVTLTKFGEDNNLSEVILKENSGFTLHIDVEDDNKEFWSCDPLSMSTDDIIIQALVLGKADQDSLDSNIPSKWIDCNKPYDGFADVGRIDGTPAMYAGSSSTFSKRITFGRMTYSGKLIIRIGIKQHSKIAFKSIKIEDLI